MSKFGILRLIGVDDLELMLLWRNSPAIRKNMYTRHQISQAEHLAWWENTKDSNKKKYFMFEFAGKPSGIVGFSEIDQENKNACWAFYASPEAPKGTGSRMEFLALEYAFTSLKVHKLYCEVLAFNQPVVGLHQKFGFKIEGVLREQHKYDDKFIDIVRLSILEEEWQTMRSLMEDKIGKYC